MPINFLSNEKSPYLLQHAQNPVMWYPWGNKAFDAAKTSNKPILLSVGYATCHWCHVMAHESFEDEAMAKVINEHFIPVKVDREERPDIDHIYMSAVTAMTGQGGWPLTVFLTPEGRPFYGGTYFPPYAKWGSPGFKEVLLSVSNAWQQKPGDLEVTASEILAHLHRPPASTVSEEGPDLSILEQGTDILASHFDGRYGGFGSAPKFPMGHQLSFLLRSYRRFDNGALKMVEATLKAMANGGIYDHLGGGFHRYSTDERWHVPHFEKMLYDQALLIIALAECFQVTGDYFYAQIVQETIDYVLRELTSPQGGFYSAQDADTDGQEGKSYVFTAKEIETVLGKEDAAVFALAYGVQPEGNVGYDPHGEFTGQNVLFFNQDNEKRSDPVLVQARAKLLTFRQQRHQPGLDDKILTDWNGLMIAALSFAGAVLNRPDYVTAAAKAADFIMAELLKVKELLHRYRDNEAAINGMLDDYAFFILGLLNLYEASAKEKYLLKAIALSEQMIDYFFDETTGGFFMTQKDVPHQIYRPKTIYDGALPSGNSAAALGLKKLYQLTHKQGYNTHLQRLLACFKADVKAYPPGFAVYLQALDFSFGPAVDVAISLPNQDKEIAALAQRVLYKNFSPHQSLHYAAGDFSAQVCRGNTCLAPVKDLDALARLML